MSEIMAIPPGVIGHLAGEVAHAQSMRRPDFPVRVEAGDLAILLAAYEARQAAALEPTDPA